MSALFRRIRPGTSPDHTLYLLHGLGSNELDMYGLAQELDPRFTVVCLRAPLQHGPGYSWFPVVWDETGVHHDDAEILAGLEVLAEEFPSEHQGTLLVGGFSQGAMMSSGILRNHPQFVDGAILLSGRLLPVYFPAVDAPIGSSQPVFIAHGEYDDVLSLAQGVELRDAVMGVSSDVTWKVYPMGHSVSGHEIGDLNVWLGRF